VNRRVWRLLRRRLVCRSCGWSRVLARHRDEDGSAGGGEGERREGSRSGPSQFRPETRRLRRCGRAARQPREPEHFRPVADAAVAARGDVEVASTGLFEIGCRGPGLPSIAERLELCTDALARPVALSPAFPCEAVTRRTALPDPFEEPGLDEFREVIRGLRPADPCELLVLAACELGSGIRRERRDGALLPGFKWIDPTAACGKKRSPKRRIPGAKDSAVSRSVGRPRSKRAARCVRNPPISSAAITRGFFQAEIVDLQLSATRKPAQESLRRVLVQ